MQTNNLREKNLVKFKHYQSRTWKTRVSRLSDF